MINKTNNYLVITECEPEARAAAEGSTWVRGASHEGSPRLGCWPGSRVQGVRSVEAARRGCPGVGVGPRTCKAGGLSSV